MDSARSRSYKETTMVEKILNDKASEQLVTQNRNEFSKIESGQKWTVRGGTWEVLKMDGLESNCQPSSRGLFLIVQIRIERP